MGVVIIDILEKEDIINKLNSYSQSKLTETTYASIVDELTNYKEFFQEDYDDFSEFLRIRDGAKAD